MQFNNNNNNNHTHMHNWLVLGVVTLILREYHDINGTHFVWVATMHGT